MSRPGGRRPGNCDEGYSEIVDVKDGVRGWVGVGIKDGEIQSGGPPPYSRATQILKVTRRVSYEMQYIFELLCNALKR